jgi:D-lactate dehydrogenase
MKILFYSVKDFERQYLEAFNNKTHTIQFNENALGVATAWDAHGFDAISVFTNDDVSAPVINRLHDAGVRFIAVRATGYDNVDISRARELGIAVANVPEYSPHAIAEHAIALMLALNRKLVLANKQVHEQDFTLSKLIGFDIHGKTIGIIGTGRIGRTLAKMLHGFGCRVLAFDMLENRELAVNYGVEYVPLPILCRESNIISIHTPLTPQTRYLLDKQLIETMQQGVMIINTSRGACINTEDVLHYLEKGHIGYFGADVYEKEKGLFFYDWSDKTMNDPLLKRLLTLPNVLITPHQAFATTDALNNIAETTFQNIFRWQNNLDSENEITEFLAQSEVGA